MIGRLVVGCVLVMSCVSFCVRVWSRVVRVFGRVGRGVSGRTTALGMVAWIAAFTAVGLAFLPAVALLSGSGGFAGLTAGQKSLFALANQVTL